jgi:hypothetical protein
LPGVKPLHVLWYLPNKESNCKDVKKEDSHGRKQAESPQDWHTLQSSRNMRNIGHAHSLFIYIEGKSSTPTVWNVVGAERTSRHNVTENKVEQLK